MHHDSIVKMIETWFGDKPDKTQSSQVTVGAAAPPAVWTNKLHEEKSSRNTGLFPNNDKTS